MLIYVAQISPQVTPVADFNAFAFVLASAITRDLPPRR